MKTQEVYLTQPRRTELLKLIDRYGGVWDRASAKYSAVRSDLESDEIKALAKERGVDALLAKVALLKTQLSTAEDELEASGFEVTSDGTFELNHSAPRAWHQRVEDVLEEKLGTKSEMLERPFEQARLKLLTIATAREATEIVESLLNFEVKLK